MLAPSEEGFRAVSSDASCRFAVLERCSDCTTTYKPRNQSREAGTSSRIFDSVETSAKYISLGPADYRRRVMEQEIKVLLEKGAIKYVPHSNRETGFHSRYFIVPKKNGVLRPILDLRVLNKSVMQLKFKMLTLRQIVSQIRS